MAQMCIYVPLEDYVAQWFVHSHGGDVPVRLIRGSVESKILEVYLAKLPEGVLPSRQGEGTVAVIIPSFRNRPPEVYNHLPAHALNSLVGVIKSRFDIELFSELHRFGRITTEQKDLIYAWMEKHEIEPTETNWNAIAKRYQRQRKVYLNRQRAKVQYSRKKSH